MKTFSRRFAKRMLSLVISLVMVLSLCAVGITGASAASVELADTGASVTFAEGDYIYIKNFKPDGYVVNWFADDVYEWMHLWNSSTGSSIDVLFELIEGDENAADAIYGAKITTAGTYDYVIFSRSKSNTTPWDNQNQTGDIPLDADYNCYTNFAVGGTSYEGSVYGASTSSGSFWVDLDGDSSTTIDAIYPDKSGTTYTLYLPSGVDAESITMFTSEGELTINGSTVTTDGATVSIPADSYTLGGDYSGTLKVMQSASVSSIYTTTEVDMPTTTGAYEHKDDYSTYGTIKVLNSDGSVKLEEATLNKIKGRGNSSWEASYKLIGKYAYNITLDSKAKLLDESAKSKKYCLVSYNADEARMRNMVIYELAQQIGVGYVADYEPVDLYNNGYYMGTYLLTDKVEIGNPLVDIYDIDGANEDINEENGVEIDEDDRGYSGGSSIDDTSTSGFYKYINMDYEDTGYIQEKSGFLLEFELNERFADEISGFISSNGQQIVCKYPELASESQVKYIMDIWNAAEALMYDDTASYEELDAVIDVESFAKMYLIQELSKNLDGGATSYYVYYDGGKLHAGVTWDYDWTLGQYDKDLSDRLNSSSDFYDHANGAPSEYGGWFINSKNIYGGSTLNAQAALCQNENFWNVVIAEWNELFLNKALAFTDGTVSSVSELDGVIADFYNQVKATTAMDENRWGLIASDPFINANWGSTDTGDTHDDAVVWLNNWYYNRLNWMDDYLSSSTYTLVTPELTADSDAYMIGDTVTLTAETNSSGNLTYTFYDADGTELASVTSDTGSAAYTYTATSEGTSTYSVKVSSDNTTSVTDAATADVTVEGYSLVIDVEASDEVQVGESISITVTSNSTETVTYTLKDSDGNTVASNDTGVFTIATTATDANTTKTYTVEATTTIDGETFTASDEISVIVNDFAFSVILTAPTSVEAGMVITLNAQAVSSSTVTYEFYASDGKLLLSNTSGIYTCDALESEIGTEKSYYVVAKTTVAGGEYTATSETKTVSITEVKEAYEVTVYFKSTSSLGYRPLITTTGAVENYSDYSMVKDTAIILNKNATQTATYYWYKADVKVSKASPSLTVRIVLSNRYAMEGTINLSITESGNIYLATDDLNAGYELLDVTSWTEAERNWTQSAVHMVYDEQIDGEDSLASVAANIELRSVGDTNGDGNVNIKDATAIQKHLAGIITLDSLSIQLADMDYDDNLTVKDATAIQKKLVALL